MKALVYYDEMKPFGDEQWDQLLEMVEHRMQEPQKGDGLYIGDDEDDNPVYVEIEPDVLPMFMGEIDGHDVFA